MKYLAENGTTLFCVRKQQFLKVPLRNHCNLRKLSSIQPNQSGNLLCDLSGTGHWLSSIRKQ